jgi:hypothetical protein
MPPSLGFGSSLLRDFAVGQLSHVVVSHVAAAWVGVYAASLCVVCTRVVLPWCPAEDGDALAVLEYALCHFSIALMALA